MPDRLPVRLVAMPWADRDRAAPGSRGRLCAPDERSRRTRSAPARCGTRPGQRGWDRRGHRAHAPSLEARFVADGWGLGRHPFAADEFLLVGPPDDPAGARDSADAATALRFIADSHEAIFLTRDARSEMHGTERELWTAAAIKPEGTPWYRTADASAPGSVAVAREAVERKAYTLLERPTYVTVRSPLAVVSEADPRLLNVFTVIPVSRARCVDVNETDAAGFVDWLLSEEMQAIVGAFRRSDHRVAGFLRSNQIRAPRPG